MRDEILIGTAGTLTSAIGSATQTNEILQTISIIITIIGAFITYVGIPLYNWYIKSKQDGKIDKDEIKDGIKIVSDGANEIKSVVEENKKEEE